MRVAISPADQAKQLDLRLPSLRPGTDWSEGMPRARPVSLLSNGASLSGRPPTSSAARCTPLLRYSVPENLWHHRSSSPWPTTSYASLHARSYSFNRRRHTSITAAGVDRVFLAKTSAITMASASIRYTRRQLQVASLTLSSWQRGPMPGIGREAGIPSVSPRCSRRSRYPASKRPALENGGLFTSPCSHASGLSVRDIECSLCQNGHMRKGHSTNCK